MCRSAPAADAARGVWCCLAGHPGRGHWTAGGNISRRGLILGTGLRRRCAPELRQPVDGRNTPCVMWSSPCDPRRDARLPPAGHLVCGIGNHPAGRQTRSLGGPDRVNAAASPPQPVGSLSPRCRDHSAAVAGRGGFLAQSRAFLAVSGLQPGCGRTARPWRPSVWAGRSGPHMRTYQGILKTASGRSPEGRPPCSPRGRPVRFRG